MGEITIGPWRFRPDLHLLEDGDVQRHLEPKQCDVLSMLASRPGRVVTKAELLDGVWGDVIVNDEVLTNAIYQLRRALGDSARRQSYIQTVPKKGYRLVASFSESPPVKQPSRWTARVVSAIAALVTLAILLVGAREVTAKVESNRSAILVEKGLEALERSGPDAKVDALRLFEKAVSFDPESAEAWSGLADTRLSLVITGEVSTSIGLPSAETAARRAIELDSDAATAWITLGQIAIHRWHWSAAERAMTRAIQLEPASGRARAAYAELLLLTNRQDQARREVETAARLAPDSREVLLTAGFVYTMLRDDESATSVYESILRQHPADPVVKRQLAKLSERQSHPAAGEITVDRIDQILRKDPIRPAIIAGMFAEAGEDDKALEWLRRARDQKDISLLLIRLDDRWTRLHSDERYRAVMNDVGL